MKFDDRYRLVTEVQDIDKLQPKDVPTVIVGDKGISKELFKSMLSGSDRAAVVYHPSHQPQADLVAARFLDRRVVPYLISFPMISHASTSDDLSRAIADGSATVTLFAPWIIDRIHQACDLLANKDAALFFIFQIGSRLPTDADRDRLLEAAIAKLESLIQERRSRRPNSERSTRS